MEKKEFNQIDNFLAGYNEENLDPSLAQKVIAQAVSPKQSTRIITIKPAWKRLSLAASIAAFALGLVMSNLAFETQISDNSDWNFGEQGLYSYLLEGE